MRSPWGEEDLGVFLFSGKGKKGSYSVERTPFQCLDQSNYFLIGFIYFKKGVIQERDVGLDEDNFCLVPPLEKEPFLGKRGFLRKFRSPDGQKGSQQKWTKRAKGGGKPLGG